MLWAYYLFENHQQISVYYRRISIFTLLHNFLNLFPTLCIFWFRKKIFFLMAYLVLD